MLTFFRKTPAAPVARDTSDPEVAAELRRRQWAVFFAITVGYGFYYVCRLSFSVAKKPMADAGIFDAAEMGIIGSALFFAYAFGKLANGILADRVNVRRFMAMGLFISALINLALGFTTAFWAFLILWGFNGWFQAFGAGSSVVTITHWYSGKERGTFYGMWASSHNIGEAITFIGTAFVITSFGWVWGFRVAGAVCILMSLFILRFLFERPDVYGLPVVTKPEPPELAKLSTNRKQWQVVTNPAVWILAISSACFYVTRYAVRRRRAIRQSKRVRSCRPTPSRASSARSSRASCRTVSLAAGVTCRRWFSASSTHWPSLCLCSARRIPSSIRWRWCFSAWPLAC
jgi:OPA family sugar phosphate sensor protein UhpC-like MFS transporter